MSEGNIGAARIGLGDLVGSTGRSGGVGARRATGPVDKLAAFLRDLGGVYSIKLEGITQVSQRKIRFLAAGGRKLLVINKNAEQTVGRFIKAELSRGKTPTKATYLDAAQKALKRVIQLRIANSGNDVKWDELTPAYAAWKRANGHDARIGVCRGHLERNLDRARVVLVKKS
jgi:hypothetical protein